MTWDEFQTWGAYVAKRGTLNLGMRMEYLMARVSLQIASATSDPKKPPPKFSTFIRFHDDEPDTPKTVSPEVQARMFATMMNAGKK